MKTVKIMIAGLLLLMCASTLKSQTLTIKVTNIKQIKGALMAGIFNSGKNFPDIWLKGETVKVTGKTMIVRFSGLPKGVYAVSVYQDMNENKTLDKNLFGIPKEPYGFSNGADKPDYEKCKFTLAGDTEIEVKLR